MAITEPRQVAAPRAYPDLHEHLAALERDGFLIRNWKD